MKVKKYCFTQVLKYISEPVLSYFYLGTGVDFFFWNKYRMRMNLPPLRHSGISVGGTGWWPGGGGGGQGELHYSSPGRGVATNSRHGHSAQEK